MRVDESIDPDEQTLEFRMAALPEWKKQQMMANIKFVDVDFSGGGGLSDNAGEAQ